MLDLDRFERAYWFATQAHGQQTMNGLPEPYIFHVSSVATNVIGFCTDLPVDVFNDTVEIACLHDVPEDTDTTIDMIEKEFGSYTAAGVSALTKDPNVPKDVAMEKPIQAILAFGRPARLAKMADRIANLSRIGIPPHWDAARKLGYRTEAQMIYDRLHMDPSHPLAMQLARRISEYPVT